MLRAAANGSGSFTIQFDNELANPIIPAGAYDMTDVAWEGWPSGFVGFGTPPTFVQIAEGATFTNLLSIRDLTLQTNATVTPACTYSNDFTDILQIRNSNIFASTPGVPLFFVTGTGFLEVQLEFTTFGNGVAPVLTADTSATAHFRMGPGAFLLTNSLATIGGGGIGATVQASGVVVNEVQPSAPGFDFSGDNNETWVRNFTDDNNGTPGGYTQFNSPVSAACGDLTLVNADGADVDSPFEIDLPAMTTGDTRYRQVLVRETAVPGGDNSFFSNADNGIRVVPAGGNTVDNDAAGFSLGSGQAAVLISDGQSNWTSLRSPSRMEIVFASVVIDPSGGVDKRLAQFNVSAAARPAIGTYTVTFTRPIPTGFAPDVQVTCSNGGGTVLVPSYDEVDASNITVYVQHTDGTLSNDGNRISVVVFLVPQIQD